MTEQVRISISLTTGDVTIEAPASSLNDVFDRLEAFMPRLSSVAHKPDTDDRGKLPPDSKKDKDHGKEKDEKLPPKQDGTDKKPRGSRSASSRPESYKTVDLQLSREQRDAFKTFYNSKSPETQNDHIMVVMYWLQQNTNRQKLNMDEIFIGLRTVGEKIPKRISSVLSNLAIDSYIKKDKNGATLVHIGEDYVAELPKTKKNS